MFNRIHSLLLVAAIGIIAACSSHPANDPPVPTSNVPSTETPPTPSANPVASPDPTPTVNGNVVANTPSTTVTEPVPDAGTDGAVDAGSDSAAVDAGPKPPSTQKECIAACEGKYPAATANNKLLDACMLGISCNAVCDGLAPNAPLVGPTPPVAPAPPVCDTSKGWSITTAAVACSDCLAANCCKQWNDIYATQDGQDLSTCASACYVAFKN